MWIFVILERLYRSEVVLRSVLSADFICFVCHVQDLLRTSVAFCWFLDVTLKHLESRPSCFVRLLFRNIAKMLSEIWDECISISEVARSRVCLPSVLYCIYTKKQITGRGNCAGSFIKQAVTTQKLGECIF